jgi:hypothetical protein
MKKDQAAYRSSARLLLAAGLILMVPLVAMQFTDEVVWTPSDFVVAGALLFGTGLTYLLVSRKGDTLAYRAATGLALGAALFLVWANLAVGLIGDEGNPANLMYLGVLAVGIVGAILARLRPGGMARALFATAAAHALVGVIALAFGLGGAASGPLEIVGVTGLFFVLFAGSGGLFVRAAREQR